MNWTSVYKQIGVNPSAQAELISIAWQSASVSGNQALLSNLLFNMNHPTGILQTMDYSGVPVPEKIAESLLASANYQSTINLS